jgi:predicted dehydrogenase
MSDLALVLAGVGHPHTPGWVRAALDARGVRLAGAWDPDDGRLAAFAEAHGVEPWSRDRLTSGAAQAALVAGRNPDLRMLAELTLGAGLPTLVEKPAGMRSEDVSALGALDGLTRVAYFLRHADSVREVDRLLRDGALGRVTLARFHVGMPVTAWTEDQGWFTDPDNVRGMFLEDGCHVVDIALRLFGPPRAVTGRALSAGMPGGLGEDAMVAVLEYPDRLVTVDFSAWEANPWVESWTIEVVGTEGTVRAGLLPSWTERFHDGAWLRAGAEAGRDPVGLDRARVAEQRRCYVRTLEAFAAAVRGEPDAAADLSHGLGVIRTIEAAYASANRNAPIELEDPLPT